MDFQKLQIQNYDRCQVISQRSQQNKNKSFEHQMIEGMDKFDNLLSFKQDHEEINEEIMKTDVERRDDLALKV